MTVFCPLASGSKGNALFLKTREGNILIDAGLSARALSERLGQIGEHLDSIRAIIITHEHHDHICGLKVLALKIGIPVIANYATAEKIVESIGDCPQFHIFTTHEPFEFLGMHIHPFTTPHDGVDPVGITIQTDNRKIGICTDLGFVPPSVKHHLMGCHLICLEANHHPDMVHASSRPDIYKRRVLSKTGHLSNLEAAQLLALVAHPHLKQVYLAHLSEECNTEEKAIQTVQEFLQKGGTRVNIDIARQNTVSNPYVLNERDVS